MTYNCYWSRSSACKIGLYQNKKDVFIIGSNDLSRSEYIERIKNNLKEFDLNPIFAIDLTGNNNLQAFCNNICTHIRASRLIIIDLSGLKLLEPEYSPTEECQFSVNVFWEYGYAAGLEKKIIVICEEDQISSIPFDIFDKHIQPYTKDTLEEELGNLIRLKLKESIHYNQINLDKKPIIDSYDEIKDILKTLLKNYLILYYSEVINNTKDPKTNRKVSLLINKLLELGDVQAKYFKDQNGSIRHGRMISTFYGWSIDQFKEKINNQEIEFIQKTRSLPVLASDLALIFFDHFEESLNNEQNFLRVIRGEFAVELGKYRYIEEDYNTSRFSNALNVLERNYGLIQQLGPAWEDSESSTEWKIISLERIEEFINKKSINIILRQLENL